MNFFRRNFRRHRRVPSAFFARTGITSSVVATYLYYVSDYEKTEFFEDGGNKDHGTNDDVGSRIGIWKLFSAAPMMAAATRTHCLSIGDLESKRQKIENEGDDRPRLIFLGTGSSTGCPKPICALKFQNRSLPVAQSSDDKPAKKIMEDSLIVKPDPRSCQISYRALAGGDPKANRDYRNNPSLLIHHYDEHNNRYKNIIIDVGKTFRETALRYV